jgi:uncharacterized Zn finger protein
MREIRPSGSVRGVRQKPYPYRDNVYPLRSSAAYFRCRRLPCKIHTGTPMATKSSRATKAKSTSNWESVTWDDVANWAGSRSMMRGRTYQRNGCVHDLAISSDGRLIATVFGTRKYTTGVWWEANTLHSRCTCPVGWNECKHAVAVLATYLDRLAKGTEVPTAKATDGRWEELANGVPEVPLDDSDDVEDGEPLRRAGKVGDDKIRKHIDAKSREELVDLVWSLTQRFPELREDFCERIALNEGDADRLIVGARKELRRATSEPGWRNYWKGTGYTPDFGRLARYLDRMVELGQADAVVKLSREIIARGMEQIGQSNDEGETATSFAECLPPIFRAANQSSLPPAQKLLFAIDADLKDEYSVIENRLLDTVFETIVAPSDWSAAADVLAGRLKSEVSAGSNFYDKYQRERIADWLVRTLTRAGRDGEVVGIREREARITGSYGRLVPLLIERKQYEEAERWAAEGIRKTVKDAPGIADQLAKAMAELARRRKQWKIAAAHAAQEFFYRPGCENFTALVTVAKRAGCLDPVKRQALEFLETGKLPYTVTVKKDGSNSIAFSPDWPLPFPDYLLPLLRSGDPRLHYDILIDMAISERHPDEVLRWFDLWRAQAKGRRAGWFYGAGSYADKVAAAIAKSHPERALEIYRGCVDEHLAHASISEYETVAAYLKKMRPILKSLDRGPEWNDLVAEIRVNYRNRPRFMEILDRLEARPILQRSHEQKQK